MSGSESGSGGNEQRNVAGDGRALGTRSTSPAKRSAADMEADERTSANPVQGGRRTGVVLNTRDDGPTDFDRAMEGMNTDTPDTDTDNANTFTQNTMATNTTVTSFQSNVPSARSAEDASSTEDKTNYSMEEIDRQEAMVHEKSNQAPSEGQKGVVVSMKWLSRVLSRSSRGLRSTEYAKEAREGPIGGVDNADIVPHGAFNEPHLKDMEKRKFIPVKQGLTYGSDYEILNDEGWGIVVGAYGMKQGQHQIDRYMKNTAPPDAAIPNLQYETYPPVFTIRKVPQANQESKHPPSTSAMENLKRITEQRDRGQSSPDDAVRLVSARSERFQHFLARSKEAAGIPRSTKVKMWRFLQPEIVTLNKPDESQDGILSPPDSRSTSPKPRITDKLVLDVSSLSHMEIGRDLEPIEANDETNNPKYNGASTMDTYGLFEDQIILLEEQIGGPGGGEFTSDLKRKNRIFNRKPVSKPASTTNSGRTSPAPGGGMMTRGRQRRDGRTKGTVGLTNLGNTCYMNSALQCIRSVEELAIYFLSENYKQDINTSNPLGHNGLLAKQYAGILQAIYADSTSGFVTPTAFKKTLGSVQPMFSGYGQQDSQEFLSFLVDALHEDLNRIIKKPYNENPDSDDSTVHDPQAIIDLGEIYRKNHKARNDSVAMDLFSGFYKNTMECPVCDKISITFDPYSLLTVQLPIEHTFQHTVTFVPLRGKPINHMIDIDKNSSIKALKEYIASKHPDVQADRLWMAELYNQKIYKVFDSRSTLAEANIQSGDYIFVFELDRTPSNAPISSKKGLYFATYSMDRSEDEVPEMHDPKADCFAVPVFSRQKTRHGNGGEAVLHPMYITVTRKEAQDFEIILKKVLIAASRLTSRPILTELGANGPEDSVANGETEDNAQVSDRSVPSEDGYVEVSVAKSEQQNSTDVRANAATPADGLNDDRPVPRQFWDADYFITPQLRDQLFAVNFAHSDSGMYCAGMTGFQDRTVRNMFDRVKVPSRRGSVESSSSGEESTTSTRSSTQVNDESEESDVDEADKPDIVLGGDEVALGKESYLGLQTPNGGDDSDNASLPEQAFGENNRSRKGRRKQAKYGKKNRRNKKRYNRKGKQGRNLPQDRPNSSNSLNMRASEQEDNPYYIKLGEGIVLDWNPDAFDALFGGDAKTEDDFRGHAVSTSDGRALRYVNDSEVMAKREKREVRKKHGITLEDCFVETGKREVLSEDNAWYCSRCKKMQRAAKTLEIWTIPDILVVHMKRFGGNRSFRDKIDTLVKYPIEGLDMTERVGLKEDGKQYVYDLFAVDNHFGGLGGGHYTAMAKNFFDGQWYDYNDSTCSKVRGSNLQSAAAYLLFYRRRSDKPLGPQYLQDLVLEYSNPTQPEYAAEETSYESDAGEGKLGVPISSALSGSSSALLGAGAGAANLRGNDGGPGTGAQTQVNSNLAMRMSPSDEDENSTPSIYGPKRPPTYADPGSSTWSFSALNDYSTDADDGAEMLLNNMSGANNNDDDDEAASNVAEMDTSGSFVNGFDTAMNGYDDYHDTSSRWSTAGQNTPIDSGYMDTDDHRMYSDAHESQHADIHALHLEAADTFGDHIDHASPPTIEIVPDDELPPLPAYHAKQD